MVTDAGLNNLKGMKQLHTLSLTGCSQVTDAGLEHLKSSNTRIGDSSSHEKLGSLLESRAKLLMEWAEDDSFWE